MVRIDPADTIRLFGHTGLALQIDVARIEDEFGIEIRQARPTASDRDDIYYPQFEEAMRHEASSMARHYEIFYCLEKSIRDLIKDRLAETSGTDWWTKKVPSKIVEQVDLRMQRDLDSAITLRSENPIDFTTFGELAEIIKANWDIFGDTFNSIKAVEKVMANLNLLRGPIAHCSPLAPDEITRLQLSLRDWFRLME